jgi:hypothetical protein
MIAKDWYRRNTWTLNDKQDFFLHFKRAKSYNKAQYLRIQALYLNETGSRDAVQGALELIELLLSEYPDPTQLENAYSQKAECLEFSNRLDEAIESYRLACQSRRNTPSIHGSAPLGFGMFVVRNNQTKLYAEIQAIFNEFIDGNSIIFPYAKYMYFATNAIIADKYSQPEIARVCAEKALQAASMTNSGFKRHTTVGLVEKRDEVVEEKLLKILHPGLLSQIKRTILK